MIRYMGAPNWKPATIEDLIYFQRGFDITKAEQKEGDVPVISSSGIKSFHSQCKVKGPGVVIGRKGTLGSVYYSECDYWPHDTTLWSKDFKGNNPKYVYYALKLIRFERFDAGAANPTLNRNHIHGLPITIPEPTTQNEIVSILDKYDDLIENNKRRIELLEELARQLYKEWFVRFRFPGHEHVKIIDGVPEGWDRGVISDFFDTTSGGTPSRKVPDFYTGDINWVKTQELDEGFIFSTEEKITDEALSKSSAKLFPENTLLVSMYGGSNIGRTGILASPAASNQACCALFPEDERSHYIYASLFFFFKRNELIAVSQGAAQTNINQQTIRGLKINFAPKSLMETFIDTLLPVYEQIKNLQREMAYLTQARDLLLPKLMNGEITV